MLEAKYLQKIRLLSDDELYQKAKTFVDECHGQFVEGKQQAGLLEFSRSWGELDTFIGHQKSRDWENISKKKAYYKVFYASLETTLQEVRDLVTQQKFVSGELPSNRKARQRYNAAIDEVAGLLAQEFIQHVVAEMRWQEAIPKPSLTIDHEEDNNA